MNTELEAAVAAATEPVQLALSPELDPAAIVPPAHPAVTRKPKMIRASPGHINWAGERGAYSGCRLICFGNGDVEGLTEKDEAEFMAELEAQGFKSRLELSPPMLANAYFALRQNMLVTNNWVDAQGNYWVLVGITLEGEELEDFHKRAHIVQKMMEDYRAERAAQKQKEMQEENDINALKLELIELGAAEKKHGFKAKVRTLTTELESVAKDNANMKRRLSKLEGKK